MSASVLVWCPVYRKRDGVVAEAATVASIGALTFGKGPAGSWRSIVYQDENPYQGGHRVVDGILNHLHQYQVGRERFLAGDWSHWLIIENDMIVPPDVIERLLACEADVAYAPYVFRHSRPKLNLYYAWPTRARNPGPPLADMRGELGKALDTPAGPFGRIIDVSGAGLGCVLMTRAAVEAVPFRMGPDLVHCDTYHTRDVYGGGLSMRANLDAICGHVAEDGAVLWPSWTPVDYGLRIYDAGVPPAAFYAPAVVPSKAERLMADGTVRVRAVRSFVAWHEGAKFRFEAGDEFTMPLGASWLREGLVVGVSDADGAGETIVATVSVPERAVSRRSRGKKR